MALVELPDPRAPVSRMDKLAMGADCTRHPLIGCVIGHGNGPPGEQARNFLNSLWPAADNFLTHETEAEQKWRLAKTKAELQDWWRRLEEWEKTNTVVMPQPVVGHPVAITERSPPPPPPELTAASKAEIQKLEKLRAQKRDHDAANAAMVERAGETSH